MGTGCKGLNDQVHASSLSSPILFGHCHHSPLQDWRDIDMAIEQGVDFIALSFVKNADSIRNLKSYVENRATRQISVVAKVRPHVCLHGVVGWPWGGTLHVGDAAALL
jgi:hypothetical protein